MSPSQSPITATPTTSPTDRPTLSLSPTTSFEPSTSPTTTPKPTPVPTRQPSVSPTLNLPHIPARANLRQDFVLEDCNDEICTFNATQQVTFVAILQSYTANFAADTSRVDTMCEIEDQTNEQGTNDENGTEIVLKTVLDYICSYTSKYVDVATFPDQLVTVINQEDPPTFLMRLQQEQLPVLELENARVRIIATPSPTISAAPSYTPTGTPTLSSQPSIAPSSPPTGTPTADPTVSGAKFVSQAPTVPDANTTNLTLTLVVSIVSVGGLAILVAALLCYRSLRKASPLPRHSTPMSGNHSFGHWTGGGMGSENDDDMTDRNVVLSPTESLLSTKSLLSKGESGVGEEETDNEDENDGTKNLQDEFDQFKDQNLEQLRVTVEENLMGFEGIMSQAVTNALMGDEDAHVDTQELLWGCDPNPDGTEIEASALFEVSDWLKRNESASGERKRVFMQEILNKMVTSVRFGVLRAEVASRTIHESAAILGLQLAEELPTTTVVISGMRKTTTANDMIRALREFGDIDVAAVASGRRGFGIVRFRRQKSVDRALRRYRSGEIVILDVSIQMKVIAQDKFVAVDSR